MGPRVSIVIPSIRSDKLGACLAAIEANADYENYEVIVEQDDPANPHGAPVILKRGVERSTGELVLLLGDDSIPQPGFLRHAVEAMRESFPALDGMVGLNDMVNDGRDEGAVPAFWLASKALLPMLGGEFLHTGYFHLYSDGELMLRCRKAGKYRWCEAAKVYHDHPATHGWSSESYDKFYKVAYEDHGKRDQALLIARGKEFGF